MVWREIDMGNGMVIPSMKSGNSFQRSMWLGQICTISGPPQGESFADCAGRARTIWNELRMKSRGDILVIGHAGWFRH